MNGDSSDMDNKVLAGIVAVVVVVVVVAAAAIMLGGNDNEEGGVTIGVNYHGNGGTWNGDTIYGYTETTVQSNHFEYDGHVFIGWNTAADGSGTSFEVGKPINYGSGTIDLYAQWAYGINITITKDASSIGPITPPTVALALVNSEQFTAINSPGTYALPSGGSAGISVSVNGVENWTVNGNTLTGQYGDNTSCYVTVNIPGVQLNVGSSSYIGMWTFDYSGPLTCEITISYSNY